jgi:outer membrane lipoprotein SlyB
METTHSTKPHALVWVAGTAVTLFSVLGIAAILGWLPTSFGHREEPVVAKVEPPRHQAATPRVHADPAPAPKVKVATAPAAAPVAVAVAPPAAVVVAAPAKACAECGVIESVRPVDAKGVGSGIGAVGGAVVGGVAGNQIGHGTGKAVATAVGAIGGGFAGNEIEKYVKSSKSYEIVVRLENGTSQTFHEPTAPAWQPGNKVKIVNGVLQAAS